MFDTAAAAAVLGLLGERALAAGGKKPNIVLIMADDLGYECLGCNGGTSYQTPELDKLAASGVRFEHCHSTPLCTPSRVQIMTGRYNFRNYMDFGILDPKEKTFAHALKKAGYATCVAGKWQLNMGGRGTSPERAGFDEHCLWFHKLSKERGKRYWGPKIFQNGKWRKGQKSEYGPDFFCDYINGFMQRNKSKPFFVYYPMCLTHDPFVPTPDSKDKSARKGRKDRARNFADMVAYMDKVVGRIARKLDELGLRENTLVLFTGDNGTKSSITSKMGARTVRGGKSKTTDAGTHVPLIANWKGTTPAGRVCGDLVDFTDFLPTLAALAGAPLPKGVTLDGRSFLPQLRGERGKPWEWVFCHYHPRPVKQPGNKARFAYDKRWKLYGGGRLQDLRARKSFKPGEGGAEAAAARKKLQAVLGAMK